MLPALVLPELLPLGVSAPPVAELLPNRPKYEKTLWRQLGWLRSVLASKFGADSSLLVSPANTKLGCCVAALVPVALAPEEDLKSIHGTATCLPPASELEGVVAEMLELAPGVVVVAPGVVLVLLVAPPAPPVTEITANSSLPEAGLMIVSLIAPISLPEELVTWAPVNWLPRTACCPMRPVALKIRLDQPD